jgi:hypothetical protein
MENRIKKQLDADNSVVFKYNITDKGNINLRIVMLNDESVTSGRVFRAKRMDAVVDYLNDVVVDETYLQKYGVHLRVEQMPRRKKMRKTVVLFKARVMHLMKFNSVTQDYRKVASSYFRGVLEKQKFGDMQYEIVEGGIREWKMTKRDYETAKTMGLVEVDITEPLMMRKANGKSRKVHRANKG